MTIVNTEVKGKGLFKELTFYRTDYGASDMSNVMFFSSDLEIPAYFLHVRTTGFGLTEITSSRVEAYLNDNNKRRTL